MSTIIFMLLVASTLITIICFVVGVKLAKLYQQRKNKVYLRYSLWILGAGVLEVACWLMATLYVVDYCLSAGV